MYGINDKMNQFERWTYALEILQPYFIDNPPSNEMYYFDCEKIRKEQSIPSKNESQVFHQFASGDEEALKLIVRSNLKYVVAIAQQYESPFLSLPDAIIEGTVGLLKAVYRFDESRGFKFISYAVWWIRQAIWQSIREGRFVTDMHYIAHPNKT